MHGNARSSTAQTCVFRVPRAVLHPTQNPTLCPIFPFSPAAQEGKNTPDTFHNLASVQRATVQLSAVNQCFSLMRPGLSHAQTPAQIDFRALKEQKKSPTLLGSTSHLQMLPGTNSCCTGTIRQLPARLAIKQAACSGRPHLQVRNSTQRLPSLTQKWRWQVSRDSCHFIGFTWRFQAFSNSLLSRYRRCAINSTPVLGETRNETGYLSSALKSQVRS